MSTTPPKEHPWRQGLPVPIRNPITDQADQRREQRAILKTSRRRNQASSKRERELATGMYR